MKKILFLLSMTMIALNLNAQQSEASNSSEREALIAEGWFDIGLPSGTLWKPILKIDNETEYCSYDQAVQKYWHNLPTQEQFEELVNSCKWTTAGTAIVAEGPNGVSFPLMPGGGVTCDGEFVFVGSLGAYWSKTPFDDEKAVYICFNGTNIQIGNIDKCMHFPILLVHK